MSCFSNVSLLTLEDMVATSKVMQDLQRIGKAVNQVANPEAGTNFLFSIED